MVINVLAQPETVHIDFGTDLSITLTREQITLLDTAIAVLSTAGYLNHTLISEMTFSLDYAKIEEIRGQYKRGSGLL